MEVPVQEDENGRLLLQGHDFSFSAPLHVPNMVANLKFVAVSPESCVVFSWDPDLSGWQDWEFTVGSFDGFEAAVVCIAGGQEEEQDGGEGGEGGLDSGGLDTSADWVAYGAAAQDHFGTAVAVAGDADDDGLSDLLVGAPDYGASSEGRAYLYLDFDGSGFDKTQVLTVGLADDKFGFSVATGGDLNGDGIHDLVIGAPGYSNGQASEGALYVYLSDAGDTVATNSPAQTIEGNVANAQFGYSVTFAGDIDGDGEDDVLVGAPYYSNGESEEGAFYLFEGTGTSSGLDTTPTLLQSNVAGARLGWSVSTAGDVNADGFDDAIVGAPKEEGPTNPYGRAYVYLGSSGGLGSLVKLDVKVSDAEIGTAVATAGDVDGDGYTDVLVGGPGYPDASTDEGAVFLFRGSSSGVSNSVVDTIKIATSEDELGIAVFTAGDVDGDGYADVVLGARGSAHLVYGFSDGLDTANALTIESGLSGDDYGVAVSTAGDVNGDGYSDIVIGAPKAEASLTDQGATFLYLGAPFLPDTSAAWLGDVNGDNVWYGQSVATAGDVNGDGYSDVVVGAYFYEYEDSAEGAAFVYLGSDTGLSDIPFDTLGILEDGAWFGYSVACAGDVDNDGYSDVVVGAPLKGDNRGIVYIFRGGNPPSWSAPSESLETDLDAGEFGFSVASAGDVNADGFADVIIGADRWGAGDEWDQGRAFVFLGSDTGLGSIAVDTLVPQSSVSGLRFGNSVASAGDVNGDGFSDVIVGSPTFDHHAGGVGQEDSGYVFVYLGNGEGVNTSPFYQARGSMSDEWFGFSVASAGDVNGNGYSDVVVGASHYSQGETREGRALLLLGGQDGMTLSGWTTESDVGGGRQEHRSRRRGTSTAMDSPTSWSEATSSLTESFSGPDVQSSSWARSADPRTPPHGAMLPPRRTRTMERA